MSTGPERLKFLEEEVRQLRLVPQAFEFVYRTQVERILEHILDELLRQEKLISEIHNRDLPRHD